MTVDIKLWVFIVLKFDNQWDLCGLNMTQGNTKMTSRMDGTSDHLTMNIGYQTFPSRPSDFILGTLPAFRTKLFGVWVENVLSQSWHVTLICIDVPHELFPIP